MNNFINTAILRLTLWYLGIIMALTIGFSVALYQIYRLQLEGDVRRPINFVTQFLDLQSYREFRESQVAQSLTAIRQNLIALNGSMLIVGGVVSYVLARRNLQPVAEALESQARFTADASHELRTPLTAMQAEIEVALRNAALSRKEAVDLLKSNLEEVGKLRALADGLLTLAQSDGKEVNLTDVSLEDVAIEAVNRLIPAAQAKDIAITNEVGALHARGDRASLIELLTILIDNAIKYSPKSSEITLRAARHTKQIHISVADHGRGIKSSDLPHIFDRFYRSDQSRSKEKTNGYGLGLSIARKIVDAHKGTIEARSAPGKGSTFTVKLPVE